MFADGNTTGPIVRWPRRSRRDTLQRPEPGRPFLTKRTPRLRRVPTSFATRTPKAWAREFEPMLRVITERQGQTHILGLHGMLGGEWVTVLEQHWRSVAAAEPFAKITVVLSEVEFIDPDGEQLLERMADAGVEFVVSGCMNRYVIEKLQRSRCARGDERVT